MVHKIELYHFGDCGTYDIYNPFLIYTNKYAPEILFQIAATKPYTLNIIDLSKLLDGTQSDISRILDSMIDIGMISAQNDYYSINFPIFLQNDIPIIDKFSKDVAMLVGDIIISKESELKAYLEKLNSYGIFSFRRLFYHIIGDYIFDGTALEYFSNKGVFKTSKPQKGGKDYILIGFEDNKNVYDYSDKLLCSSNNYYTNCVRFNSFGDSNGNRNDLFRFFRQIISRLQETTPNKELNLSYINFIENYNKILATDSANFIKLLLNNDISVSDLSEYQIKISNFLKVLGYIEEKNTKLQITVPVFYEDDFDVLDKISSFILHNIENTVTNAFDNTNMLEKLTSTQHGVNIKETANELWHQIFGHINEYLIAQGFYKNPLHINGQGRYFQSIYIED